jgi:hypothetical protein
MHVFIYGDGLLFFFFFFVFVVVVVVVIFFRFLDPLHDHQCLYSVFVVSILFSLSFVRLSCVCVCVCVYSSFVFVLVFFLLLSLNILLSRINQQNKLLITFLSLVFRVNRLLIKLMRNFACTI